MDSDRRRLMLVRDTVFEARRLADGRPLDFDRMRAVWLADLAVELTLATIASDYGLHPKQAGQDFRFEEYFSAIGQQIDKVELQELKPFFSQVRSLHKSRNRVHDGIALGREDTKRAVTTAETFIGAAFAGIYQTELEHMSLLTFLNDGKAKTWLLEAKKLADDGNYEEAAFYVSLAFEQAKLEMRAQLTIGRKTQLWDSESRVQPSWESGLTLNEPDPLLTRIASAIEISRFGISIPEAIDFLDSLMPVGRAPGTDENDIEKWVRFDSYRPYDQTLVDSQIEFVAELLHRLAQSWRRFLSSPKS